MSIAVDTRNIISISELNLQARNLLEKKFPSIWVEGEISNLVTPSSGHLYFTLKDSEAQVRAAMFRGNNRFLSFTPRNGMQVMVHGRVSLYAPRGDYQLIADDMEESGEGALRRAYERLKQKLAQEGLFDEKHKKTLPKHPAIVGVITSPTGAAIHDVLTTFKRRFPATEIILFPTIVQGKEASASIELAIKKANTLNNCDVLVVGRGGGSLEDLWAFNEEAVARAIFSSNIPIVAAVGHEIDFTIADFVADIRAPTPTAAAELVCPDQQEILAAVLACEKVLSKRITSEITNRQLHLNHLGKRLKHPGQTLQEHQQSLDILETRLKIATLNQLISRKFSIENLETLLRLHSPYLQLQRHTENIVQLKQRLIRSMEQALHNRWQNLQSFSHRLETVSPLATLSRGYSLTYQKLGHKKLPKPLTSFEDVNPGDVIRTKLKKGTVFSTVTETSPENLDQANKEIL